MAKKEIRVNFNLDNKNEKELYEFLLSKTSASGYLKDLALDFLHGSGRGATNAALDTPLNGIATALQEINSTLSNLKVVSSEITATTEGVVNSNNIKELDIEADDLDF